MCVEEEKKAKENGKAKILVFEKEENLCEYANVKFEAREKKSKLNSDDTLTIENQTFKNRERRAIGVLVFFLLIMIDVIYDSQQHLKLLVK